VWSVAADGGTTLAVGGVFTEVKGSTYRRPAEFQSA
jgi:hypothetical protein